MLRNCLSFASVYGVMWRVSLCGALIVAVPLQPGRAADTAIEMRPLAPPSAAPSGLETKFEAIDGKSVGVDFTHYWVEGEKYRDVMERTYVSEGGGVTVGDVDGDSRPDIYLSRPFGGGRLYRNLGDFRFADVTASSRTRRRRVVGRRRELCGYR